MCDEAVSRPAFSFIMNASSASHDSTETQGDLIVEQRVTSVILWLQRQEGTKNVLLCALAPSCEPFCDQVSREPEGLLASVAMM